MEAMASGSADPGRPWTAASSWTPAGAASVDATVSFETSANDAEAIPSGVLLVRPPSDDDDGSPCEITVHFREKHEIHRVYVRSTARIYEIYYSTDLRNSSKDYLCTVRCGLAVKEEEPLPSAEESIAQCQSGDIGTMEKHEHETRSISSNSDEDSWVEVKIPESPVKTNTTDSQQRNTNGTCQRNTLVHYEATAEIADASPCVSLTVRLLSLRSKTSVHIEEIYIFADPVESTNDDSVIGPGNMGGSSLLAMLVPGLMQMSKSRNCKIDDRYFSDGSRLQLSQGCTTKESSLCGDMAQAEGPSGIKDSRLKSAERQVDLNPTDGSTESNEKNDQDACSARDPNLVPLQKQVKENTEDMPLASDEKVLVLDQLTNPLTNENTLAYNRVEKMLDALVSKVEKIELYCSRFEDNMMRPLNCIETRLQRLEQQFDSFAVEIVSLRGLRARLSAPEFSCDTTHSQDKASNADDAGTSIPSTNRQPGLAVRAPDFSVEDSCYSQMEADENPVTLCGPKMMPGLLVKAPEFACEPEFPCKQLHDDPSSPADCVSTSATDPRTYPSLAVKVPEFANEEDDDAEDVEEEEEEDNDHDDSSTKSDDSLHTSTVDSSKCKTPVSIEGALASALAAFLASTKATYPKSVASAISNSSPENINDGSCSSVSPKGVDEISSKPALGDQFPGTFGEANKVGALAYYEDVDAVSVTSLAKSNLEDKGCDELDPQDDGLSLDLKVLGSSTQPLEVPPHSPEMKESINERAVVTENRPDLSLAAFLAARNSSSFNNNSVVLNASDEHPGGADTEVPSFERISMESSGNFFKEASDNKVVQKNDFNQHLLVKQALEVDEDESKNLENQPIEATSEGSSYVAPENGAFWHSTSAVEAVSVEDEGLKSTQHSIFLSGESNSVFYRPSFHDSYRRWIEDSCSDSSLDETFIKPEVPIYWSDVSSTESLGGASSREAVIFGSTATSIGNSVNQEDLIRGIGLSSTDITLAGPREELQKVFDLLSECKDDILDMTFTQETHSKSSPSLEVLLGRSSDSEVQVSVLEDDGDADAGFAATRLFSTSTSPEVTASATSKSFVDVEDLPKPSETYTGGSNGEYLDSLI